jgi:flagellar basal-body rod modification protein FlgD
METSTIFPAQTAEPAAAQPATAATRLSSDFEVFLTMLTAQMKYQDPLNPVDSTDYATQLATFSGVEQAVQTNDLLRGLSAQLGVGGLGAVADWVGKEVRAVTPVAFSGQPVRLYPQINTFAENWEVSVRNETGQEIQRLSLSSGSEQVIWNGVQFGGQTVPDGTYSFVAIGKTGGETVAEAPVETYAPVIEARLENGTQMLVLAGDVKVSYDAVTAIRAAQ